MNTNKKLSIMAISFVAVLSLAACSNDKAEEAGETVDNIIANTKDAAENTGNAIEDACEDVKDKMDTEDTDC